MIAPGKKAPVNLDSYLAIFTDEIRDLSKHGMLVRNNDSEVARVTVHLAIATGDLVGVAKLMHHGGVASRYGCMKCIIDTSESRCFSREIKDFTYRKLRDLTSMPPNGQAHIYVSKNLLLYQQHQSKTLLIPTNDIECQKTINLHHTRVISSQSCVLWFG